MVAPAAQRITMSWDTDPLPDWIFNGFDFSSVIPLFGVRGSGDISPVWVEGLPVRGLSVEGVIKESTAGTYGAAQDLSNAFTMTNLTIIPHWYGLGKRWNSPEPGSNYDLTGPGDGEKVWNLGAPQVYGTVAGSADASGPGYTATTGTMTAVLQHVGTIGGTAKFQQLQVSGNITEGGNIGCAVGFVMSGAVTYTPAANTDWMFETDNGDTPPIVVHATPPAGVISIVLDNGDTITHYVKVWDYFIMGNVRMGGPERIRLRMICNKAPA